MRKLENLKLLKMQLTKPVRLIMCMMELMIVISSSTGRAFKSISHFIIIQKGFRNWSIPKPFCLQSGGIRMEAFFILYSLLFLIF
ncbi:hypothetical protein COF64_21555 [Bacillus sp. AFS043905]|nr:hypothetical protein COF64_21555 [Bacillus sp. AFS043905]